ncbi:hypothetical protein LTR85_003500 [Meristemomyces frigidus]|nr:hypothetical protein LTR85_003500 [Meristemomyces frigidus]
MSVRRSTSQAPNAPSFELMNSCPSCCSRIECLLQFKSLLFLSQKYTVIYQWLCNGLNTSASKGQRAEGGEIAFEVVDDVQYKLVRQIK